MRGDDRGAGNYEGAKEGAVGDVGDVDHHAETVHLVDHVFAELGEAFFRVGDGCVVDVAGAVGPAIGVGPGEGHVADAEGVVLAEEGERILNGMAAFNPHEGGEFVVAMGLLDAFGRGDKDDLVVMFGDLLLDSVNKVEGTAGEATLVGDGIDPDGEELGAEVAFVDGV